jgi:hypothetical protein
VECAEVESQRDMCGIIAKINVEMRRLLMRLIHPRSIPAHSFTTGGTSTHASISTCAIRYLQSYSFILVSNVTHPKSVHCSHFPLLQSHQPAVRKSAC